MSSTFSATFPLKAFADMKVVAENLEVEHNILQSHKAREIKIEIQCLSSWGILSNNSSFQLDPLKGYILRVKVNQKQISLLRD